MSETFDWCKDKTKLAIFGKQVFHVDCWGTKWWSLNGKRHRGNGPALEYVDGRKRWCLNGIEYFESDYWKELKK